MFFLDGDFLFHLDANKAPGSPIFIFDICRFTNHHFFKQQGFIIWGGAFEDFFNFTLLAEMIQSDEFFLKWVETCWNHHLEIL